uniref:tRNA-5-taurinomethyluridine 2-sulfurtransferase n=1 Tax=Caenorhabditis tropicalis TaxID=1561998 RepID=A0A1I7UCX7_9PELO
MSGGVDSAVSAFLLKKKGFDVIGVHMINWDTQEEGTSQCSRSKDESDAKDICNRLNIPFHTVNFVKEYWNDVFLRFLENYKRGRTTVPDIDCNQSIKFDAFHKIAQDKFDADFIATGHYATTNYGDFQQNRNSSEKIRLLAGRDPLKDQTFFLCTVTQKQLNRAMFPLGSLEKSEVKRIAEEQGFHRVAQKPEVFLYIHSKQIIWF